MDRTDAQSVSSPDWLAYLTYPLFMASFMALSVWCVERRVDPEIWIPSLTVLNFLVILGLEQWRPRRRSMNTLRDWQSINDAVHGTLTGLLRPVGTALGLMILAALNEARLGSVAATCHLYWDREWFPNWNKNKSCKRIL